MLDFFRNRKVGRGKKRSLSDMSEIAKREREKILRDKIRELINDEFKNSGIENRIVEISKSMEKMDKKIEDLKSSLVPLSRSKDDSIRKIKIKRMVLEMLKRHNRLTASELGSRLGMSRTRCNEYLKELERNGITKGILISRQKFYELEKQNL